MPYGDYGIQPQQDDPDPIKANFLRTLGANPSPGLMQAQQGDSASMYDPLPGAAAFVAPALMPGHPLVRGANVLDAATPHDSGVEQGVVTPEVKAKRAEILSRLAPALTERRGGWEHGEHESLTPQRLRDIDPKMNSTWTEGYQNAAKDRAWDHDGTGK